MAVDKARGLDAIGITVEALPVREKGVWHDKWTIEKFASDSDYKAGLPFEVVVMERANALLYTGINEMWNLIGGGSANHYDNTNARLGVGESATAVTPATDTDLLGSTKTYKAMEATYPTINASQKIVFRSVFGSSDANNAWNEFVAKQNTSSICLNRLVSAQGTKASGQTWTLTLEISLT